MSDTLADKDLQIVVFVAKKLLDGAIEFGNDEGAGTVADRACFYLNLMLAQIVLSTAGSATMVGGLPDIEIAKELAKDHLQSALTIIDNLEDIDLKVLTMELNK